ncbi:hypothetical protein, partial [Neomoorella mulderi]|uniref:hypothetical protein n=1 Tax=Neomoorella mulderi TaxID=202604 RepID=UPI001F173E5D
MKIICKQSRGSILVEFALSIILYPTFRTFGYNYQCLLGALKNTPTHHRGVGKGKFPCRNQQVQGL